MSYQPLIPYLELDALVLVEAHAFGGFPPVPLSIQPFGTLVAAGVYIGAISATRHGRRLGLNARALASFITWVVGIGFIGGHILDTIFYFPHEVLRDPWSLLRLWEGLSSFGGFIGALGGALLWKWRYGVRMLPYAEAVAASLPVGFGIGRAACAVVHDHPGAATDAWFAVQFPDGGRFDLGLYEFLSLIPLAIVFLALQRRPRPWGFYVGVMSLAYAPSRFALDFLRARDVIAADPRYGGLTPAQWACMGLLLIGVGFFLWAMRHAGDKRAYAVEDLADRFGGLAREPERSASP